jgi:dihydroxyacetone kinase
VGESHLQPGDMEIGLGIHNEPGTKRLSPVPSLHDLVQQLLEMLLSQSDPERSFLAVTGRGDEVVLLVNNLGGVSELELGAIVREVTTGLAARHVKVERIISGAFMVRVFYIQSHHKCIDLVQDEPGHARLLHHAVALAFCF